MSTPRAVLIGAGLAVLLVAGVAAAALFHLFPTATKASTAPQSVVVATVLPGSDDDVAPRVIDVYIDTASGWTVRSVSPSTSVEVPGTSGSTLADAYSFGGGVGLVSALAANPGIPVDAWVIVDEPAWRTLHRSGSVTVDLPADVEVFDGVRVYSFPSGNATVPADQLPQLLVGSAFLSASEDAKVRGQVGDLVGKALGTSGAEASGVLHTNLSGVALQAWLRGVGSARRIPGS